MPGFPNKRLFYFIGLLGIIMVYCSYYMLFMYNYSYDISIKDRHIIKFGTILLVYGIGTWALKKYVAGWMMKIWHFCYILALTLLLLIGIWDWIFWIDSIQVRNIANSLHEILISPILYIAMGIINSRLAK
jgi:hypothetical protein